MEIPQVIFLIKQNQIITMVESQNVEYKESWRDEYLKWICGFANAQGGRIYIGIRDDGSVNGVPDAARLLEDIPNKIRNSMGILADVNLLNREGKNVVEIIVPPVAYPVSCRGEYHYRCGSTKQELRGSLLTEFLLAKTGRKWDAAPVDFIKVADLDPASFRIFREEARRSGRVPPEDLEVSDEELLEKLGLLTDGKLKRAAVLLFYSHPERLITGSFVKIAKFSSASEILYHDDLHGSLLQIADQVVNLIYLKYLKATVLYSNELRLERFPFERAAVREAVFNALIHNNYAESVPIQIRIEDDAMYISNTGVLPPGWTTQTLLDRHQSRPYNPDIANTFYRAGYVETWGRGIRKICDACREAGKPQPEYSLRGWDLTVKFSATYPASDTTSAVGFSDCLQQVPHTLSLSTEAQGNGLTAAAASEDPAVAKILPVLISDPAATLQTVADRTGIALRTVERKIRFLREKGVIQRTCGRRFGRWVINRRVE